MLKKTWCYRTGDLYLYVLHLLYLHQRDLLVCESNKQFLLLFLIHTQCQCSRHCTGWAQNQTSFAVCLAHWWSERNRACRDSVVREGAYGRWVTWSHEVLFRGNCYMGAKICVCSWLVQHLENSGHVSSQLWLAVTESPHQWSWKKIHRFLALSPENLGFAWLFVSSKGFLDVCCMPPP